MRKNGKICVRVVFHQFILVTPVLDGEANVTGMRFPVVVPVWMISFSFSVIALKWIMIWRYQEGTVTIPNIRYLQWWAVDRAVELWEFWIGGVILDTPLINIFYFLMGAKIHITAQHSTFGFVRSFFFSFVSLTLSRYS